MKNILLVHIRDFGAPGREKFAFYVPPLGIGYIGAYLRSGGFSVELADFSLLSGYQEFAALLKKSRPNMIGLSVMTPDADIAYAAAKEVRQILPGAVVVMGGPHPTVMSGEAIACGDVDIAVIGEGEATALELAEVLRDGAPLSRVDGIIYKENGEIKTTHPRQPIKDLDGLPFPARDIIGSGGFQRYAYQLFFPMPYPYMTVMASRGCYGRCAMCQPTLDRIFGRGMRYRSAAGVVAEIKSLKKRYGIKSVIFWDDTFTFNKSNLLQFCELLRREELGITWWSYSRANTVDEATLVKMKKAGCRMLCFGIESGSERVLREVLRKGVSVEHGRRAMALCKKHGILVNANVMIGSPTETLEDVRLTDSLLKNSRPEIVWAAVTSPLPGTELGDEAKKNGLIVSRNWSEYIRGYSGKIKLKSEIPFDEIRSYQNKWHLTGFKAGYLAEPQYIRACLIRCLCHIKAGNPFSICDEFLSPGLRSAFKKIPFVEKIYRRLRAAYG